MSQNVDKPVIPDLHRLKPSEVQELIEDLRLRQQGARLYYAVDPSEVFDFCFPINPYDLREQNINVIADDQAALYEIFYVRPLKPVLLKDYAFELKRVLEFITRSVENVYTKTEMVNGLIQGGLLEGIAAGGDGAGQEARGEEEILDLVQEDFNIILAVAMGIFSLGVERFQDVLSKRLLMNTINGDDAAVREIFDGYQESDVFKSIFHELSRSSREKPGGFEKDRRMRADRVDAYAIDRMIYLNAALERAYREERLSQRHVILYLSSAPKTERIFSQRAVRDALPEIDGKPYPFWRTRAQVFAYVVHKSEKTDPDERVRESIANLEGVRDVLDEVQKLGQAFASSACSQCVLTGKGGEHCDLVDFCRRVKKMDEVIQQRRKELFNLGLLNTIESYRHLLNARPTERSHKSYMEFFGRLYEGGIKDAATERMQQLQRLIQAKAEFTNKLPEALGKGKDEDHRTAFLRNDRDAITGTAQYLPTKPRIRSKKYEGILRAILDYYKTPPQGSEEKAPLIDDAYKAFIEIDTDVNRLDPEHELIRCLLYMAFPRVTGDRQAYDYAAELLINKELMAAQPGIEQEYIYVICWAARRLKEYSTAHYYAELGIRNWPDDPRFYHGRCLNTAAWLGDEKKEAECRLTLRDAIEDARRALDLYGRDGEESRDLIGACYNNLAYLWAEYAARESCTAAAVTEARRALLGLKEWTEKERWVPNHPEYLHTEAYVEFQEYSLARIGREDEARLRAKLEHARREIDKALALVKEKPLYDKLKREIDKALTRYASEP